ncbi:glycosyltransferase [Aquimarina sp. RZ0]|uniref:glycosyltransferase n=1 Tax=Aquimarina sp. RZ0 TaxID=2607730 RepID=UPI0011F2B8C3|nr:glycosyltransferase [Aquimarina sp. RZ0]KAA1244328.1 glycosyltransferase [Aquimarina sp. RZ0]
MKNIIVLIPHYNNQEELLKSIQSIDDKIDVDILVVDDGSVSDIDEKLLKDSYSNGVILFEYLKKNSGIEIALNTGLKKIQELDYKYIGRLDCGDYCLKNKFTKQIEYLDSNPEVKLLGSWVNIMDKGKLLYVLKHPTSYDEIKKKMYLNTMFVHPSVVFQTSIIEDIGYYPINYKAAEDYAYFFNIINEFKSENFPEPLLDYIIDENSISSKKRKRQVYSRIRVILCNFSFGFYPIYGLFRNVLLLFISRNSSNIIKKLFRK